MNSEINNCASVFHADVIFYSKGHYPKSGDQMADLKKILDVSCGGGSDDRSAFEIVLSTFLRYCRPMEAVTRLSNVLYPHYIFQSEKNKSIQAKLLDELLGAISILRISEIDDWDDIAKHEKMTLVSEREEAEKMEDEARKQELEDAEFGP